MAGFAAERRRGALLASGAALFALAAWTWPRYESASESRVRYGLAGLLVDSGRTDLAVDQLRQAVRAAMLEHARRDEVLARTLLAKIALETRGDLESAEADLAAVLRVTDDPLDRGPALASLGNLRFRECWERRAPPAEKLPEALAFYEQSLRCDPGPGRKKGREWVKTVHYGRASVYLYAADAAEELYPDAIERALESARSAVAEDPEYAAAHAVLGRALIAAGDRDAGLAALRASLPLFSEAESATKAQVEALLRELERP
jgi:tetratricopeptide (TPR) repeat protein